MFDPSNFVQNTLTAVRTLEQIDNQINQLQNEAQMLMNQARNLAKPATSNMVNRLRPTLATTERLIAEAQGLAYDVQNMDATFPRLYPEQYAATVSGDQMLRDAQERWKNALNGLHTAMRMQAQVSAEPGPRRKRTGRPREPEPIGHRRTASHAGNEPASRLAGQSSPSRPSSSRSRRDRAASLELARQAAAVERGREVTRRFLGSGTPYTPAAREFLRELTGAAMNDVTVIDRFLDTFSRYIDSGFGLLQGEVAFLTATLIVIDMTIAGLYWAMSHATGQGEDVIAKLLRKVLYVGAFAYIIDNFNWLASIVFRSFAGLGLTATGSTMTMENFLQPGRLAKTGIDAAAPILEQIGDMAGFPEVFVNLDAHRGDVPRVAGGDPVLLRAGDPAFHHADRVQADHARGLRAGAVRAVEQDQLPGRKGAGQRGVVRHQGAGAGGDRGHRLGPVRRVPGAIRPSRPSTMRWSSCWPRSPCWRWGSSARASPPGWCPVRRSSARARWPVLPSAQQERRWPSVPPPPAWAVP